LMITSTEDVGNGCSRCLYKRQAKLVCNPCTRSVLQKKKETFQNK